LASATSNKINSAYVEAAQGTKASKANITNIFANEKQTFSHLQQLFLPWLLGQYKF
jgi:hypothetical protein